MRQPTLFRRESSTLEARLRRVKEGAPAAADPARRRLHRFWLGVATAAVLLCFGGALLALVHSLNAPPPAYQTRILADGTMVRLVAVTRGDDHAFRFQPADTAGRRLLSRWGWRLGDLPIEGRADVPAGSVTLWLWVGRRDAYVTSVASVRDEAGRLYVNSPVATPLQAGMQPWGRATLCWVSLTNFDRTARQLSFLVPVTHDRNLAAFTLDGPAEPAARWPAGERYPLEAGDQTAGVRLWQLRPADPLTVSRLVTSGAPPGDPQKLLIADLDVVERAATGQPGQWAVDLVEAVTDRGERLRAVANQAGLLWLTNERADLDMGAVRLSVTARKWVRDRGPVVFRGVALPAKVGEVKVVSRQADEPFPDGKFTVTSVERLAGGRVRLSLEGRAPAGTTVFSLRWAEGLDSHGRSVGPLRDPEAERLQTREGPGGVSWQWTFEANTQADATAVALAFSVLYRRVSASTDATLIGTVQSAAAPARQAGLGLLLAPVAGTPPRFSVAEVVKGTQAAAAPLREGDEVVAVDGLSPAMLGRVLLRHTPGNDVAVTWRRGAGPLATTAVGLDAVAR